MKNAGAACDVGGGSAGGGGTGADDNGGFLVGKKNSTFPSNYYLPAMLRWTRRRIPVLLIAYHCFWLLLYGDDGHQHS